jgi:methylisocitrate lyase
VPPPAVAGRIEEFRRLHESGCFVMPNPWDAGSAVLLAQLGFPALATTSSGIAWTLGRPDHGVPLDTMLEHVRAIVASVPLPINADLGYGFAVAPDAVGVSCAAAAATGIAGLSIEDAGPDPAAPILDFALSVERIRAARQAIDDSGTGVLLTARAEGLLLGRPDLGEILRRLSAFAEAGADCLYAPGVRAIEDVKTIVRTVAPKPVNVLVGSDFTTVAALADAGVRRISVGGALARTAWTAFLESAREIAGHGTFGRLGGVITFADLNGRFK